MTSDFVAVDAKMTAQEAISYIGSLEPMNPSTLPMLSVAKVICRDLFTMGIAQNRPFRRTPLRTGT